MSEKLRDVCKCCEDKFFKEHPIKIEDYREYQDDLPTIADIRWANNHNSRPESGTYYDKSECRCEIQTESDDYFYDEVISHDEANQLIERINNDPQGLYEWLEIEGGSSGKGEVITSIHFVNECSNDWADDYKILNRNGM